MELTSLNLAANFAALLLFLYALFLSISRRLLPGAHRNKRLPPPEAGGGWPVIGHLHKLSTTEPTHISLAKMADAYGPIFTLKLGMNTALVVSSWEIAKECFTTNDRIFASRPKLAAAELLGYNYAMIGASPYGPYWRHVRKIATLELLTNHRIDQLQHVRVSEVQSSIDKLRELCANNEGGKVLVEMKTWFGELTLNTIFRMVVGKRFSTAFEGSGGEQYRAALRNFVELFGTFVPSDSFPFLSWFDLGGYKKAMKKTAKILDEILDKWMEEHREKMNNNSGEAAAEQDFMGVMLSTLKDDRELTGFDVDTVTKATCLVMILGGTDTTTATMTWALSLLLNNPEILKKAQLELHEKVGRQNQVKESDVKNLIYLQAIVKETLRLYPPAPLLIHHESTEDCTVSGYHVPAGTRLLVNLQKLQKDSLVWKDPSEFRPERFITGSQNKFDVRGQNLQLIPFGSGRRMCPGISLAVHVMHLTLANLLHGFEIGRPSQELLNMEESFGLTILRKTPLEVVLTPILFTDKSLA